jgi:hypothetical protein
MLAVAFAVVPGAAVPIAQRDAPVKTFVERARPAGEFADSLGVNVHLSYHWTPYARRDEVAKLVRALGVHHLRDGVTLGQPQACAAARRLAEDGVRFTFITQTHPTAAQLTTWASCAGPALEAFEGVNEYDISHPREDEQWVETLRASQHELYEGVKGTPALSHVPVIGPSLTSEAAFRAVGDLSPAIDAGNVHDYFAAHEPETRGWGLGDYGSIAYNINVARVVAPRAPLQATETGYGTDATDRTVDETAQAAYLPRLLLEHFRAGLTRTFAYELIDEGGPPFEHYGIVRPDLTPKPAFRAIASLIALLRDDTRTYAPITLRYAIDGNTDGVQHVLLQKRDGRFVLAVWLAARSYDPVTRLALPAAERTVELRPAIPLNSAALYAYGADWQLHRAALSVREPLRIKLSDRVAVVELVPERRR